MTHDISQERGTAQDTLSIVELIETAFMAQGLEELAKSILPTIAREMHLPSTLLYVADPRLPSPRIFQNGFPPGTSSRIEELCLGLADRLSGQSGSAPLSPDWKIAPDLLLYPLKTEEGYVGMLGLAECGEEMPVPADIWTRVLRLIANAVSRLVERAETERQLIHLNTYLTVSSMLSQSLDLHELLEVTLYCCMDAVSAEAASVLLLDDDKKNFHFYQVEGPAKPVLAAATFPADQGLAGSVLSSQQSEVINDVRGDPRFYQKVDSETGFQTRNMIAIPLVAGEEEVGVLEVLNKVDEGMFTEEEHLLLVSVAEEIAFAIRNARMFEYVVNSYCKQRQGETSCRGCERPLGSWTPCIKYREVSV